MKIIKLSGMTALGLVMAACGGGGSGGSETTPPPPTNIAPVATAGSETLLQNSQAVSITLSATDADGDALTYSLGTQPTSGTVTLSGNVASYQPNADFSGADSFTFLASDGLDDSDAAAIDLTVQATSSFAGKAQKIDGTGAANVTVQALDEAGAMVTTAMSDADGAFTLTAAIEQNLVLNFLSDDYANQVLPVTMPELKSISLPLEVTLIERGAAQTINIDSGGEVSGANGASVTLASGSFVDESGASVTGTISAQITPVDVSNPEVLAAFPGDFTGIDDLNNMETAIASLGTVEYVFTQNGEPLQLGNGATAEIQLPIYGTINPQTGNPIEMGDEIELWSLNEETGVWDQEGTGTVVASPDSPNGLALQATVSHFTWWNIDVPIPTADVDITLAGTVTGGSAVIHARAPSDFGGFRTANRNVYVGSTTTGLRIPAGRETCFWIEYVDLSGANALSDEQCISDAIANSTYPLTFNVIAAGALDVRAPYVRSNYFVNKPLSFFFSAASLETAVSYTVTSGALPAGLSLMATSPTTTKIVGSGSAVGSYVVTIEGTDSDNFTDSETISFSIVDTPPPSLQNVATVYTSIGSAVNQAVGLNINGADAPTSWIVTQSDGSPVPAGVSISSSGVFTIASFDGLVTSYLVTAYNAKGASNAVTINVLDSATAAPILFTSYSTSVDANTTVDLSLASLNSGGPATSWTITDPDGSATTTGASISNAGVLSLPIGIHDQVDNYEIIAYNGTVPSNPMPTQIVYFDPFDPYNDPCFVNPDLPECGGIDDGCIDQSLCGGGGFKLKFKD